MCLSHHMSQHVTLPWKMSKPKKPRRSKTGRPWSLAQSPQLQEVQLNITEPSLSSEHKKKHVMILGWYCDDIVMLVMSEIVKHMSKSCEVERVTNLALSRASSARLCSSVWFVRCVRAYASSVNQPPLHSNIPALTILHHVLQILRFLLPASWRNTNLPPSTLSILKGFKRFKGE